jgi:diguanylate cyclase (GGDEF)-like protein
MMALDTATLRVAFAVVALSMLMLFYFVTFRSTRSTYCGWWCAALAMFLLGSSLYLLDDTEFQWWANPLGNALVVSGAVCVWAGARSLKSSRPPWWQLAAAPAVTAIVSFLDHPASNVWSGGRVFLLLMSTMIGLSSWELWRLDHDHPAVEQWERAYSGILRSMALASATLSVFYLGRWIAFVAVGPDASPFTIYFGSQITTLITTVLLATVSFSMSALSNEQKTQDLRTRATRDGLTGLLNRTEFMRLAAREIRHGNHASVILADLDNFKSVNDTYGHDGGDQALELFANACRATVRGADLIARYGGEEFIFLLPGISSERAMQVTADISDLLRSTHVTGGIRLPTVSYGIASTAPSVDLASAIASADAALYRAKALGRNRAVRDDDHPRSAETGLAS